MGKYEEIALRLINYVDVDVKEASKLLGCSRGYLINLILQGKIKAKKEGNKYKIPLIEIIKFLDRRKRVRKRFKKMC